MEKNSTMEKKIDSLWGLLQAMVQANPEHILFSFEAEQRREDITVRQWTQDVQKCAGWLKRQKIEQANLGICCDSCYEWFVIAYAVMLSGNIAVFLNKSLPMEELQKQIKQAEVTRLFWDGKEKAAQEMMTGSAQSLRIYEMKETLYRCREEAEQEETWESDPTAPAMILFSSGTGGLPKGVKLSVSNLLAQMIELPENLRGETYLLSLPPHHISGVHISFVYMINMVTVYICKNSRYLVQDVVKSRPDILGMVPAQLEFLMFKAQKRAELKEVLKKSVKSVISLGAVLNDSYVGMLRELDIDVANAYGMTETTGNINAWHEPQKEYSLGKIAAGYTYKIVDGELIVKGESVMQGYYQNPEATQEVLKDGWLYTGDLVRMDEEGNLYLTGRKKNIILLSNGENISPEELEKKINGRKKADELIVTGRNGCVEAVFYLGESDTEAERELFRQAVEEVNQSLTMYQKIRKVTFAQEPFERTSTGKIKRF